MIADEKPLYIGFLGVERISEMVLTVDRKAFAWLLGIKTMDRSLFHQQGTLQSCGFVQASKKAAQETLSEADREDVDDDNVSLLTYQPGILIRGCTEEVIERCKSVISRSRP
jgi:hypothetical protein